MKTKANIPLADFITLQRGFDLTKKNMNSGSYPVVGSTSVIGYHDEYKVDPPGVVTGRSGSLGTVQFIKKNFWPHNTSLWVKDFKGNDPNFVYYTLKTLPLADFNVGVGVPTLNRNHLSQLKVYYFPLEHQEKIANILKRYDDLIKNNSHRIQILEGISQRLYEEWFVSFKFPGHEKIKMVDSELGKIPEGWRVVQLSDLYNTAAGGTPSRKVQDYFLGDIRWIKTKELNDSYVFNTEENISIKAVQNSSAKIYPEKCVLIAMYGATIGRLGINFYQSASNQACCAISPKHNSNYDFKYIFLTLLSRRQYLIDQKSGAAQQNINQQLVKQFKLLSIDDSILQNFNKKINPLFNLIANLKQKNHLLKNTRDLLLPRLIAGEIKV